MVNRILHVLVFLVMEDQMSAKVRWTKPWKSLTRWKACKLLKAGAKGSYGLLYMVEFTFPSQATTGLRLLLIWTLAPYIFKNGVSKIVFSWILIKLSLLFMEVAKFTKSAGYLSLPFRKRTNTGTLRLRHSRGFWLEPYFSRVYRLNSFFLLLKFSSDQPC